MSKIWLVAERQFNKSVFSRGFVLALLGLPFFLGLTIGMGELGVYLSERTTTLGYVDEAGVLTAMPSPGDDLRMVRYGAIDEAHAALTAGEIDAYVHVPSAFKATRQIQLVYAAPPGAAAVRHLQESVRRYLLAGQSPAVVARALGGPSVSVRALDSGRTFPAGPPAAGMFVPLMAGLLFAGLFLTTAGTLMEVTAEEKENRTMEVVISSLSPLRMMAGKIIGTLGMALLLCSGWLVFLLAALWAGRNLWDISWLQAIHLDWGAVAMVSLVALPSLLFMGAFATLIGTTISDTQDAQQIGPLLFFLLLLPTYLIVPIAQAPNGMLAVAISLFPPTAAMTLGIRHIFMAIPTAQFLLAAGIALASGLGMVWLAGKAFRLSMLRYGQPLRPRELFTRASRKEASS
jgi:ABC-2 type transport system permease protein